jgi:hypothetical protein
MAESKSDPPKDVHASRLKYLGTLVAAVAALVTAVGAYLKPQDHSVNKASYEELSKVIKELSDESEKNHDDIVALRGYVEGAVSRNSGPLPVTVQDAGSASLSRDAGTAFAYVQLPPPSPLPSVRSGQRPPAPPNFDSLVQQSKK